MRPSLVKIFTSPNGKTTSIERYGLTVYDNGTCKVCEAVGRGVWIEWEDLFASKERAYKEIEKVTGWKVVRR